MGSVVAGERVAAQQLLGHDTASFGGAPLALRGPTSPFRRSTRRFGTQPGLSTLGPEL